METETWRDRLRAEIAKSGHSMRAISLKAEMGPGYVFSILSEGKDPTIDHLLRICGVLNVSLLSIVYGLDVSPEMEEVFQLWRSASPATRAGIVQILRQHKAPESQSEQPTNPRATARPKPRKAHA